MSFQDLPTRPVPRPPSAWKVASGICWSQCNDRQTARRLAKVNGVKLVACSVTGDFLRIYELPWRLIRARTWARIAFKSIYGPFLDQISPETAFVSEATSSQQTGLLPCLKGEFVILFARAACCVFLLLFGTRILPRSEWCATK